MGLADKVLDGNIQAAARLISGLEEENPEALAELDKIYPHTGKAAIIGITGAPGIGKSTLISSLTGTFRKRNLTVGIIAVDPSSPFTGGALLGDRIRMQSQASDKGVFIRSLAARGYHGGLAGVTLATIHVMDAMGKDFILVETVGTGQNEVDIAGVADTTIVMLSGESGDDIQLMKAGIMEIADIFAVNKADKGGAEKIVAEVEAMLALRQYTEDDWRPPVVLTDAISGKGIDKLAEEISRHREYLSAGSRLVKRRENRARREMEINLENLIKSYFNRSVDAGYLDKLANDLALRKENPGTATRKIIEAFLKDYKQTKK
jgi:LAO/AO transport system kinase